MKTKIILTFCFLCIFSLKNICSQIKINYDIPGNYTWTCPLDVDSIKVECWGGGGGGGGAHSSSNLGGTKRAGGGGGGGNYSASFFNVTPNNNYNIVVGSGGVGGGGNYSGSNGNSSIFGNNIVVAGGGSGGVRGNDNYPNGTGGNGGVTIIGQYAHWGGNGADGSPFYGGGGGSGAGFLLNGINGYIYDGGIAPFGGGNGGNGGEGPCSNMPYNGLNGLQPGGGGGGGYFCNVVNYSLTANGGNGGNGKVVITYLNKKIYGSIYNDINKNCIKDNLEEPLSNIKCYINPGNIIFETDNNGMWYLDSLPIGNYILTAKIPKNWNSNCILPQFFTITNTDSIVNVGDIGLFNSITCTDPEISIIAPILRLCISNKIYVKVSNNEFATAPIINSYVDITLSQSLPIQFSSISYTPVGNNKYRIQIDTIYQGQHKWFFLAAHIDCLTPTGQTLCFKAELFPADTCVFDTIPAIMNPDNPIAWTQPCNLPYDQSNLIVEGWCLNDTVHFTIINNSQFGIGDMNCYSPVRIYLDGVLIFLDSIKLNGGASKTYSNPGNGQTWILQADQHPLYPGNSHPTAFVEACSNPTNWTPDLVNNFPLDDADPVIDIYCGIVTGSFDPNDKTGYPTGIGSNNYIHPNQPLEYVIRFQNTGNDTAFTVIIRDTLDTNLNILSVIPGVCSHNNEFRMYGPRILEWKFDNILLPDSNVNEPESHGFVTYKVEQVSNLINGTIIKNDADIYFDYNSPITTNQTSHFINDSIQPIPANILPDSAIIINGLTSVCKEQDSILYNVSAITNATSYIWTLPQGATGTSSTDSIFVNYNSSAVSGNITVKGQNAFGAGSITSLAIVVNDKPTSPSIGTIQQPTCTDASGSVLLTNLPSIGTWTITISPSGTTITESGTSSSIIGLLEGSYCFTVTNSDNCTSNPSDNVVINSQPLTPPTPTIVQNGNFLISSAPIGNQWYDQNGIILNAIYQNYVVTSDGNYYVIVTLSGCSSDTSNIINVLVSNTVENLFGHNIFIYPNPASDELLLVYTGNTKKIDFEIINLFGQVIYKDNFVDKRNVDISSFVSGIYTIKFFNNEKMIVKHFVKK